jgi:hypothetical protein
MAASPFQRTGPPPIGVQTFSGGVVQLRYAAEVAGG